MTPKQLKKYQIESIIKVKPHQTLDTDEAESTKDEEESTSTELSENSTSDTPSEATEESKPIEVPQVPTVFSKSRCDQDPSENRPVTEFESPKENGEQITVQGNKLKTEKLKGSKPIPFINKFSNSS